MSFRAELIARQRGGDKHSLVGPRGEALFRLERGPGIALQAMQLSGVPRGPSQHHSIPEFSEAP